MKSLVWQLHHSEGLRLGPESILSHTSSQLQRAFACAVGACGVEVIGVSPLTGKALVAPRSELTQCSGP